MLAVLWIESQLGAGADVLEQARELVVPIKLATQKLPSALRNSEPLPGRRPNERARELGWITSCHELHEAVAGRARDKGLSSEIHLSERRRR